MLRLTLLVTGIISFIHFISPSSFSFLNKSGKTLGLETLEASANTQVVSDALNIYCINHTVLPKTLNELYNGELSANLKIDLDKLFNYSPGEDCNFSLEAK